MSVDVNLFPKIESKMMIESLVIIDIIVNGLMLGLIIIIGLALFGIDINLLSIILGGSFASILVFWKAYVWVNIIVGLEAEKWR